MNVIKAYDLGYHSVCVRSDILEIKRALPVIASKITPSLNPAQAGLVAILTQQLINEREYLSIHKARNQATWEQVLAPEAFKKTIKMINTLLTQHRTGIMFENGKHYLTLCRHHELFRVFSSRIKA